MIWTYIQFALCAIIILSWIGDFLYERRKKVEQQEKEEILAIIDEAFDNFYKGMEKPQKGVKTNGTKPEANESA